MGSIEVLIFLVKEYLKDAEREFSILEITKILSKQGDKGSTERNIRRAVVNLEARGIIRGHSKGKYDNWRRYYKLNPQL